jgi:LPS-assembly protein
VAQRYVTTSSQRTSAFFVQLELNGLGRIGLDPFDILTRNIPGYRPPSTRPATPSRFFGYE